MSYSKVSDGLKTIDHTSTQLAMAEDDEDVPLQMPKTYIACDKCGNPRLDACKCKEIKNSIPILNYFCQRCGWRYRTHYRCFHSEITASGQDLSRSSLLAKTIRK